MSTVPRADTPPPANNAKTYTLSGSAGMYGRPTAGGNAVGGTPAGGSSNAPPGPTPSYSINMTGAAVTNGGPNIGHGATQIVAEPNASGAPETATDGGTVGTSLTP